MRDFIIKKVSTVSDLKVQIKEALGLNLGAHQMATFVHSDASLQMETKFSSS